MKEDREAAPHLEASGSEFDLIERGETKQEEHLDEIDIGIINILLEDGTKNLSQIASVLKVGIATVHRRLRKLRDEGVIEGYTLLVNPKKLGLNVIAITSLKVVSGREQEILKEVEKIRDVTEIYKISGQFEIILKIKAGDLGELNKILDRIKIVNGIQEINTSVVLEVLRDQPIHPIGGETK